MAVAGATATKLNIVFGWGEGKLPMWRFGGCLNRSIRSGKLAGNRGGLYHVSDLRGFTT